MQKNAVDKQVKEIKEDAIVDYLYTIETDKIILKIDKKKATG